MGHELGELAVIRVEDEAGGQVVEAPHVEQAFLDRGAKELLNERAAFGVGVGDEKLARLVHRDVDLVGDRHDLLAVDGHDVRGEDLFSGPGDR